ncbi:hypothetical protein K0B96_14095 [Horticoccus luteus]|uniref:Uncharacterized protein n=1 Tax=Horticoccus luteus TaxID=2862869 RepID=A0A8F9TUN9_9BACT|nr:DUF6515 family protein [Horticoccus luteus]QYM78417.1 hypothetical protein K0B96_14095 [Horticoccus luteus]
MKTTQAFRVLVFGISAAVVAATSAHAEVRARVKVGIGLPNGFAEVHVGKDRYFEHRGTFYRPGPRGGYVVVRAPRGAIVHTLPPRYVRIYLGNTVYYRYDDVYYRPVAGGYVIVDAPTTTVVTTPAPTTPAPAVNATPADDYQSVWVGPNEYLFHDGQFFRKTPDGLVWMEAPMGALTKTLPADAQSVWYQDVEYFECDNVYFRKTPDGYKVVETPWKG